MTSDDVCGLRGRSRLLPFRSTFALAAAAALAACASSGRDPRVAEIAERHAHEHELFENARAEFARREELPRTLDFGGDGSITVLEAELQGRPEHEELRLLFTFENTTRRDLQGAYVTLSLGEPASAEFLQELRLTLPIPTRFQPTSTYTTAVYVPLRGIYIHPGWTWKIVPTAWGVGERRPSPWRS